MTGRQDGNMEDGREWTPKGRKEPRWSDVIQKDIKAMGGQREEVQDRIIVKMRQLDALAPNTNREKTDEEDNL